MEDILEDTDYGLIKKCIAGDGECFSEIVARYKKLVYSVVYNMLPDKEEVNDISQEVFLRIYKSLGRYNPEYKFSTWSSRIAVNLCLDILRKKKPEQVPLEDVELFTGDYSTPESNYIRKEDRERVRKAINKLPEKYRTLIVLFHQNGMSYEEMTKILNEPMTIIKNRLYRARQMLKDMLAPHQKEGFV